jgi:4-hydroxybenzoate polyprenyltransferase
MQPYLRLARVDKPIGTYLLLWPGYWGLALAATPGTLPDWRLLAAFGIGTVVMRSAGCTVNDLWDRDIDKNVARTKHRPITSGEISVRNGVVFLGAQLLAGLGVLVQLNEYSIYLGMASVPLVLAYPLMKRWTDYPQLFLGVTFNWGVLMGWAATHGACYWPVVLPLYASAVAWTMVYDTLYAHQDKKDDARLGLHSTALTFGEDRTKPILAGFSAAMIGGLLVAGVQADLAWPFYVGTGLTAASLMWQLGTAELNNPVNLAARFEANKWVGGVVFGSIVAGRYFC